MMEVNAQARVGQIPSQAMAWGHFSFWQETGSFPLKPFYQHALHTGLGVKGILNLGKAWVFQWLM